MFDAKEYAKKYVKLKDPRRLRGDDKSLLERRRKDKAEELNKITSAHRQTIFTGGYELEGGDMLHGYSEGFIL